MAHLLGTQSLGALAGSRQLLADVDISVEDTSRIGILGPNGAGKSTLLRLVAGVQQPDDGQVITRDGLRVVMLEQADHLDDNARVMDAVHPGLEVNGLRRVQSAIFTQVSWLILTCMLWLERSLVGSVAALTLHGYSHFPPMSFAWMNQRTTLMWKALRGSRAT